MSSLLRRYRRSRPEVIVREVPGIIRGRVPPHNLDAEAVVLSAILLDQAALDRVLEILKPEHFYSDANGRIYEGCLELHASGTPVDVATVAAWLEDRQRLVQIGGRVYLAQLADATPAVLHVGAHAQIVREKWRLRALIATCQRVAAEGYGDVGDVQEFVDGAEQDIYDLARTSKETSLVDARVGLHELFRALMEAAERGDRITGISTGLERLDAKTAGLHAGEVMVIAGRPGMAKTSLALGIASNVASPREVLHLGAKVQAPGHGVCIFSLEMPLRQVAGRLACSESRVPVEKLRAGQLQPEDWRRLTEASRYVSSLPLWIDDTPALGLLELRARIRRKQAEYNRPATDTQPERKIGLVVIDYLQLMKGREGASNREQEINELSRGIKALAKELGVPIILLSQLNRECDKRSDKRPQLSDLRDSGGIEQDADTIIFIYRDEYYNPETSRRKGIAELIIAKQRDGAPGAVLVAFTGACTRFDNLSLADYPGLDDA